MHENVFFFFPKAQREGQLTCVNACFCFNMWQISRALPSRGDEEPHPLIQMPQQNDVIHVCDGLSNITTTKKSATHCYGNRVISKERQHRFVCGLLDRFQEIERWEEEEWEMKLRAAPVQISGRWFSAIIGQPHPPPPHQPAPRRFKDSRLSPLAETLCSARRENRGLNSAAGLAHAAPAPPSGSHVTHFPRHPLPECAATMSPSFRSECLRHKM